MTKEEFKRDYYCLFEIEQNDYSIYITSKALSRIDERVVDSVKTIFDTQKTNQWIQDSNRPNSLVNWNVQKLFDQVKRFHLDYFAQNAPIEGFYPLNATQNPDIEGFFKK